MAQSPGVGAASLRLDDSRLRPAAKKRRRAGYRREGTGFLFAAPALLMVVLFFIVPLCYMVWMAFEQYPLLGAHKFIGLQNFRDAFKDRTFTHSVVLTVEYTLLVVPLLLVAGLGLASLVSSRRRGASFFRTIFFLPVVVGLASASYLWYWLVDARVGPLPYILRHLGFGSQTNPWLGGMPGALFVVTLMIVWKVSGLTMLLLMTGLQSIPVDIVEAARVDGAGRMRRMRSITLPLLRNTIALVLILTTAGSFLAFDQFYVMTKGGPANQTLTIAYWIYHVSFVNYRLGYGAALSVMLALVLLVISALQLRVLNDSRE
jgi:multiple sugar transport system permease protein